MLLKFDLKLDRKFVRLGENDNAKLSDGYHEDVEVDHYVVHPGYRPDSRPHDIAILFLKRDVDFSGMNNMIMM